jgi:hypothetical protein
MTRLQRRAHALRNRGLTYKAIAAKPGHLRFAEPQQDRAGKGGIDGLIAALVERNKSGGRS